MNIMTRDFGEVEISEEQIINFPTGIFAFEDSRRFTLLSPLGEGVYPMWLQSVDNSDLCFIVFTPIEFDPSYSVFMEDDIAATISLNEDDEILFLAIAVVPDEYKDTTVNLKSPIIVNLTNYNAVQIIAAENYPLKHPVFLKEE